GGAVGDDGHRVLLDREGEGALRIIPDGETDAGDPRCIRHRQVVAGPDRDLALDLDLAAEVHEKRPVRDIGDAHARDGLQAVQDVVTVTAVARLHGDVSDHALPGHLHQVD